MVGTRIAIGTVLAAMLVLSLGCSAHDREGMRRDAQREGSREAVDALQNRGDNGDAGEQVAPAELDAVFSVGNEVCPLMGHPVDQMVIVNGYEIGVCCPGCAARLAGDIDDETRETLQTALGIDVAVPASEHTTTTEAEE